MPSTVSTSRSSPASGKSGLWTTLALLALAAGGVVYWQIRPSPERILSAESLSPEEIRYVATRLLLDDSIEMRARASQKLASLGAAAIPVLTDLSLHHEDGNVRAAVLDVLLAVAPKEAEQILGRMMADQNAEVRAAAAASATVLPREQSSALIIKGLQDADSRVRLATLNSAAQQRDPGHVPALEAALDDSSPLVRRHAARTLQLITGRDYSDRVKPE